MADSLVPKHGGEVHEFSAHTVEAQERQARLMQQMEAQRRARTIAVPTLDADVRSKLRKIGRPITLFGERPENRRDRLRKILAEVSSLVFWTMRVCLLLAAMSCFPAQRRLGGWRGVVLL